MFSYLPGIVIPRRALLTVGTRLLDPMRRIRQAKESLLKEHGLLLLNGQTPAERERAKQYGIIIRRGEWVAVPVQPSTTTPRPTASSPDSALLPTPEACDPECLPDPGS